jgi:glycosyltransferase involved in cell wall biosynthesis
MNRHCRIAYFTNSTVWGGVEQHICGLLRTLARDSFDIQLVCDPTVSERFKADVPADIGITSLALSKAAHLSAAVRFARWLRRGSFDIVHSHMFWSSMFASPIARACGVPVTIETLHGTEAWRTGWKARCPIDRAITAFVSHYIAVCKSDARFLESKKHLPVKKISIVPNGVDSRRFLFSDVQRHQIRRRLGYGDSDLLLIAVARLHRGKGHRILLRAMQGLVNLHPTLKLVCLGEGEEKADLLADCSRLRLTPYVHLPGYQRNVEEWLAAADINVLPSYYEGLPLTILEAMAAGLPTAASEVGGIPDAIQQGVSGLLVPPGNPERLAEALALLLRDPALRARLGQSARMRVAEHFAFAQQVKSTEQLYLRLSALASRNPATPLPTHSPHEQTIAS